MEEEKKDAVNEDEPDRTMAWLIFFVIASLVFVLIALFVAFNGDFKKSDSPAANILTAVTKKAPAVTVDSHVLTELKFYVYAVDNYDEVDVTFSLLDEKGGILTTQTLQGFNYRKGNTYVLSQSLSLSELWNGKNVKYSISYYK